MEFGISGVLNGNWKIVKTSMISSEVELFSTTTQRPLR